MLERILSTFTVCQYELHTKVKDRTAFLSSVYRLCLLGPIHTQEKET